VENHDFLTFLMFFKRQKKYIKNTGKTPQQYGVFPVVSHFSMSHFYRVLYSTLVMAAFQLFQTSNGVLGLHLPTLMGKTFIPLREIIRLEGQRNYTLFVLNNSKPILVAKTLGFFDDLLPVNFVRISRGSVINLLYIVPFNGGNLRLKDGYEIPVSRRRVKHLEEVQQVALNV
jgi:DNA-binding LytR/AlgR family response regulator